MNIPGWLSVDVMSLAIMVFITCSTRNKMGTEQPQQKSFRLLAASCLVLLVADLLGYIYVPSGFLSVVNKVSIFVLQLMYLLLPLLWLDFVSSNIYSSKKKISSISWYYPAAAIFVFCTVVLVISQFNGGMYGFTSDGVYERGPLYMIMPISIIIMMIIPDIALVMHRSRIDQNRYFWMILYPLPPIITMIAQMCIPNMSFVPAGTTLAILMIYVNIQNRSVNIDYLTGAFNRRMIDMRMYDLITRARSGGNTFAAVMVDIDGFKAINDKLGHNIGDDALKNAVNLIRHSLRPKDFVGRYGGDEFCIMLDVSDEALLRNIILRIEKNIWTFNEIGDKPYDLGFSMGSSIYDPKSSMDTDKFQKHIDSLMYEAKLNKGTQR
mgnify:CR=1 FL=1|jgi:diguanylate cyclase (GGDEF) domain